MERRRAAHATRPGPPGYSCSEPARLPPMAHPDRRISTQRGSTTRGATAHSATARDASKSSTSTRGTPTSKATVNINLSGNVLPTSTSTRTLLGRKPPPGTESQAAWLRRERSTLEAFAALGPELGFLELLEPEERGQWIRGWLEPRLLRPLVRQHLRDHALLLELDEVVSMLAERLSLGLGAYAAPDERNGLDPEITSATLSLTSLRARGPGGALAVQLITCCREAARLDVERAQGRRTVIPTPRLLAIESLTGLVGTAACAWLAQLSVAPLRVRLPWQARMDAWDGTALTGLDPPELEVEGAAL